MSIRVAFIAAECEPWAKTGGLADVVDALARALGSLPGDDIETPIDVFLPRYRGMDLPADRIGGRQTVRVPASGGRRGAMANVEVIDVQRSEERRVGKECA